MSYNNTNQKNDNERTSENNKIFYNRKKFYNNNYDYNNSNKINSNWRQQRVMNPTFQHIKYSNNYYTDNEDIKNKKKEEGKKEEKKENIKQTNNWKDQVLNNQAITSFFIPLNIITKVDEPIMQTTEEIIKIDKYEFIIDKDKEYIEIDIKLDTLDSLIELGNMYDIKTAKNYTIDLKKINNLIRIVISFVNKLISDVGFQSNPFSKKA
jgi:hypothetical protein